MCGRYTLHTNAEKLARAIKLAIPPDYAPDYNIGPGREILSIAHVEHSPAAGMMHWGLKTPQNFHVNARIETVDTAPRFRENWELHRCLVPANGFYEWYADGITKEPYYLYPTGRELAYLAGLWYPASKPEQPGTCILLTAEASPAIQGIHHRMPVLLPEDLHKDWLAARLPKAAAIGAAQQTPLAAHRVSQRVNSIRQNDSKLIRKTSRLHDDQMTLF
jgi:putative SOS response-associated peptidase YedK